MRNRSQTPPVGMEDEAHRYRIHALDGSLPDMQETCTEPLQEGVRLVWCGNRHVMCEVREMPEPVEAGLDVAAGCGGGGMRDIMKNGLVVLYSALVNSLLMAWGVTFL